MGNNKNKFITLTLGVITSLILLEISLRMIGFIHLHKATEDKVIKKEKNSYVILCLGDSFTLGTGAPMNKNYPRQLEGIFKKEFAGMPIRIVNRGIGSFNTAMILNKFDECINETNPDLIILLAGGANIWNAYGYSAHLNKKTLVNRLWDYLYSIKTFKLIILLSSDIEYKCHNFLKYKSLASRKTEFFPNLVKGNECEREGRYNEAIMWYKKVIEKMPNFSEPYFGLGRIYLELGNEEESKQCLKKAIEINPRYPELYAFFALYFIEDQELDKENLQFLQKYINMHPAVKDIIEKISDRKKYYQEIRKWITSDIEIMIQKSQVRGIKIILQNYPNYRHAARSYINEILKIIAQKYPVPFVDNERVFEELFLNGENKDDYFALDKDHCNAKGYSVMAENLYDCIIKNNLTR